MARLAGAARGTVGVAAIHLETGRSPYLDRAVAFPMASTYQLPIAVQLLTMVDEGRLRPDSLITVPREDVYRTASTISDLLHEPGLVLSVRNLLELMLSITYRCDTGPGRLKGILPPGNPGGPQDGHRGGLQGQRAQRTFPRPSIGQTCSTRPSRTP